MSAIRGFHICEFCQPGDRPKYSQYSSGDVTLVFEGGGTYEIPDMMKHYVGDHRYKPPQEFITDVMEHKLLFLTREERRKVTPKRIGYLEGKFETGDVPGGFLEKLDGLMQMAELADMRVQYRGATL